MSEPQVKYIRHEDMYKPQSPLFATYPMVEYYHYSDAMEENASLKEEVDALKLGSLLTAVDVLQFIKLKEENARLKAENENAWGSARTYSRLWIEAKEIKERLEADVERLRKAGDALYESEIGYYGEQILEDMKHHSGELCRNWNAAKEGKPSV